MSKKHLTRNAPRTKSRRPARMGRANIRSTENKPKTATKGSGPEVIVPADAKVVRVPRDIPEHPGRDVVAERAALKVHSTAGIFAEEDMGQHTIGEYLCEMFSLSEGDVRRGNPYPHVLRQFSRQVDVLSSALASGNLDSTDLYRLHCQMELAAELLERLVEANEGAR